MSESRDPLPFAQKGADFPVEGEMMAATAEMLVYLPDSAKGDVVRKYAQYLRGLLGGHICYEPMMSSEGASRIRLATANCDLVVFGEPEQTWLETLLSGRPCGQAIAQSSTSFLLARRPRWPIKSILLILRVENTDQAAVEWLVRLAQPGETAVTILPIVPSLPAMYRMGNRVQAGLEVLLSPNTPSGRHLRRIAQQLEQLQIEGDLHLRQGEPDWQIRDEVAKGNYDLILVGAEPHGRIYRFLLGELVGPLLCWIDRPLLIAQPPHQGAGNGNGRFIAH
jgi:nucleotide-binding universal stress UspA family protein